MPTVNRTVTVELSTEEVSKLLIEALGLPSDAKVNFNIGHHSDPMDRYSTPYCNKVSFTYSEATRLPTNKVSNSNGDRDYPASLHR